MDFIISRRLSNDRLYAYCKKRFWIWDDARCVWKESHLMSQKYEREHAARAALTPEQFMTDLTKFQQLDEFELDTTMLDALKDAKPCRNAPIEPVEELHSPSAQCSDAATAAESQTAASPAAPEGSSLTTETADAVQNAAVPASAGKKNAAPSAGSGFDFSALGVLSRLAAEADQQFDLHYGTAQDEYLISCIYLARIHTLTARAGRYGGGTWTKWCESKGISEGSSRTMVQNGEAFNSATIAELKQLPNLTRKDLNLIARYGCAEQLTAAAGDSQRVQELLAQVKAKDDAIAAEKARADAAETREEEARKAAHEYHEKYEEAAAMRATLLDQQGVYIADIDGLKKQNVKLQQSKHDADEDRIAARLQCQKAEGERDRAEERAKDAENQLAGSRQMAEAAKLRGDKLKAENDALKKQPIAAVVDEEEVDRRAHQQAYSIAADMTIELKADKDKLTKDNAALRKQLAALRAKAGDDAQADFESANFCVSLIRSAWDANKASYSRLTGEDLESTFQALCGVLNGVMEEASRLCRQPADYDGGADHEPDV